MLFNSFLDYSIQVLFLLNGGLRQDPKIRTAKATSMAKSTPAPPIEAGGDERWLLEIFALV
jgi:hypothetical protein